MKNIFKFIIFIIMTFILTGCGQEPRASIYKWNQYSQVSAVYLMHGEQVEVSNLYEKELLKIIEDSKVHGVRVPPGVYAELGEFFYKSNKKEEAKKYFLLEKNIYPESTIFINNIVNKLFGESL